MSFIFYKFLFLSILFNFFLACIILSLSYLLSNQANDLDKTSSYECGFDPFNDAREPFDVKFYLVSILFIIFDLEILFLFPWVISYIYLPSISYFFFCFFLFVVSFGFFFEWKKNALNWD